MSKISSFFTAGDFRAPGGQMTTIVDEKKRGMNTEQHVATIAGAEETKLAKLNDDDWVEDSAIIEEGWICLHDD